MKILHLEASPGWGGQELRILREAEGMRQRGHEVILGIQKEGGLIKPARESGFTVFELEFTKKRAPILLYEIIRLIRREKIELINTHSSLDAWIGGIAARLCGRRVIRTRHLSTPIGKGINSYLLYNKLADYVVTTCREVAENVRIQANLPSTRCHSIPTGVDPTHMRIDPQEVLRFREHLGVKSSECLIGTLCILRGWKGISDFLLAAKILESVETLKWVVVGSGVSEAHFHREWEALNLRNKVFFTGHLSPPYTALAAMDIFLLLSRANEGVSQASLQAAWLEKPLITTPIGGLKEVCVDQLTGLQVPIYNPESVAAAVMRLAVNPHLRTQMGQEAKKLVQKEFLLSHTLDQMERVYGLLA